ncbi:MAG: phosphate acyltransferase PlsX [Chloroflexi bacterium]|nr:phosphate acyltransferase PlsX [Chloroflexota bacterium]
MKIAIDVMGGDHAPQKVIAGIVAAAKGNKVELILVGNRGLIEAELATHGVNGLPLSIIEANQVITMDEPPAQAIRQKRDSSIMVGVNLVKRGEAAAFVSAGNSGAVMAAALVSLGTLDGIERPALGIHFPTPSGVSFLIDAGVNAECKPSLLVQFARMGSLYMEKVLGIPNPKVGLLSIGEEATKGNQWVRETHDSLKKTHLNFIGNIEANNAFNGIADVVVTDGFTGNIAVKLVEGVAERIIGLLNETLMSKPHYRLAGLALRPAFQDIAQRLDYREYGGGLLLGTKGVVVIAHGRSDARAIENAILRAKDALDRGILSALEDGHKKW